MLSGGSEDKTISRKDAKGAKEVIWWLDYGSICIDSGFGFGAEWVYEA